MLFSILGPVEVRGDRGPCEPASPMSRQVLSLLLVHANQVVPLESLVEELWDDTPPKLARKTVQTYIYHVRKALREGAGGGPWVQTESRGYRLRVGAGQLDLWRFQELCARGRAALSEGRPGPASDAFREALALWRGPAFSGTATGALLSAEQARLEDLRMAALEQRIEADMELGVHRELLSELKGLTLAHPLNEVLAGRLMRAAARSGHREVALDAYRRLRAAMVGELGLEPSAEVRDLQRSVLEDVLPPERRTAPAPAGETVGQVVIPAELPPRTVDFTGRARQVAAIVAAGRPAGEAASALPAVRVVVVTGGVGTGKTVTAVEASHQLRGHYPGGQLFATLHRPDGAPVSSRDALTSLLLSSGHPDGQLPTAVEDLARLFRSWTSERRMLVVLDDAGSPGQLIPLLPSSPDCAVVVTSRWRLEGLPGAVTRVELKGMSDDEGVALLGGAAGARRIAGERFQAAELVRLYDGLPLAVRALGERLAARPDLRVRDLLFRARDGGQRLAVLRGPQHDSLRRVGTAHQRLPAAERELLSLLCWLPRPVRERDLLRAMELSGRRAGEFDRLVESLVASHSVEIAECREGPALTVPVLSRLVLSEPLRVDRCASPREVAGGAGGRNPPDSAVLAGVCT
ncbi:MULTISPECIES: AfsR/SARP family transcriptional regulator [Streptomyces]|uniref:AfsR/SARP family transcriptional regulator n=1 Tax=Streptomyces TaxID=1883 RepID=UPI000BF1CDBB|nr:MULTISPECIES: AfsR/SARP family transcriptional regulator [unclassified Streptomyces]WTE27786.1 AfsR/SARP family transcriptional regulator [Streptomyces anulatus]